MKPDLKAKHHLNLNMLVAEQAEVIRLKWDDSGSVLQFITDNIKEYGYDANDFISGKLNWEEIIHTEDLSDYQNSRKTGLCSHEAYVECQYRIRTMDGVNIWVKEYSACRTDKNGMRICCDSFVVDHSKTGTQLEQLQTTADRQNVLMEILSELYTGDVNHVISVALRRACQFLHIDRALILEDNLQNTRGTAIFEWYEKGNAPLMKPSYTLQYEDVPGMSQQMDANKCYVRQNTDPKEAHEQLIFKYGFPIIESGRRQGLILFGERQELFGSEEDTLEFLRDIVKLLTIALKRRTSEELLHITPKETKELAYHDYLTQLPNRYNFEMIMKKMIQKSLENGRNGYVLLIDIDDFKLVNDGYGHSTGDQLLAKYADYLKSTFGDKYSIYRYGDDEFILLIDPQYADNVQEVLDEILKRSIHAWRIGKFSFYCSISIGVVCYPSHGENVDELMRNADAAMLQAKRQGKNGCVFYTGELHNRSAERVELEKMLREAVYNNFQGFEPYFQPLVHAKTKRIRGAEALIRWKDKEGQYIPPAQFIPLAEYLGLIVPIGDYMLRHAALLCKRINDNGRPDFSVSVNVSVKQLQKEDFIPRVLNILTEVGVNFENITLEITEGLEIPDLRHANLLFDDLRERGIKIAIDDFGTGYSSLSYMREMSVDLIKIDRAFVHDLGNNVHSQAFIRLITELSHSMGKKVCIEGVETAEQMAYCVKADADLIQGYFYYKAMPAQDVVDIFYMKQYAD